MSIGKGQKAKPRALRHLAETELGLSIQAGEHSPIDDARSALYLYHKHRKVGCGCKPYLPLTPPTVFAVEALLDLCCSILWCALLCLAKMVVALASVTVETMAKHNVIAAGLITKLFQIWVTVYLHYTPVDRSSPMILCITLARLAHQLFGLLQSSLSQSGQREHTMAQILSNLVNFLNSSLKHTLPIERCMMFSALCLIQLDGTGLYPCMCCWLQDYLYFVCCH